MQGIWSTFCCVNQSVTVDGPAWCLQSLLWHGEISQNVTVDDSACCFAESIVMWRWAQHITKYVLQVDLPMVYVLLSNTNAAAGNWDANSAAEKELGVEETMWLQVEQGE